MKNDFTFLVKKKTKKYDRIIIYTFVLYKFPWVPFSVTFSCSALHIFIEIICESLMYCYRLSADSYIYFQLFHFFSSSIRFVWNGRIETEEYIIWFFYIEYFPSPTSPNCKKSNEKYRRFINEISNPFCIMIQIFLHIILEFINIQKMWHVRNWRLSACVCKEWIFNFTHVWILWLFFFTY